MITGGGGEEASVLRLAGALRRWLLAGGLLAAAYLVTVWLLALVGDDPVDWLRPLPNLQMAFAGGYVGMRIQRRRLGGAVRMREYDRALRTGRLPEGADRGVWRPLLEREQGRQRQATVAFALVVGVLGLCWGLVAGLSDGGARGWLSAVLGLVLFGAFLRWAGDRQTRRIRRLLDQTPSGMPPAG